MARLFNLALMTTSTTGTGTVTLGSAVSGYLTFAQAGVPDGARVSYGIRDGSNSEVGTGVYTSSGTTLTRTVIKSTNSDAAINLSGSAQVYVTALAEDFGSIYDVKDYGAVGDGATNDTSAVQAALTAIGSSSAQLYFPAGTYLLSSSTISKTLTGSQVLIIKGAGIDATVLYFPNNGDGLSFTYTANSFAWIGGNNIICEDVSFTTNVQNTGKAISISGASSVGNPNRPTVLNRVGFRGTINNSSYWTYGVYASDLQTLEWNDGFFYGYATGLLGTALTFTGTVSGHPTLVNVHNLQMQFGYAGVSCQGYVEGLNVAQSNFSQVDYGVIWNSTTALPQCSVSNSQINAKSNCISLTNATACQITGNLFFMAADAASGAPAITGNPLYSTITGNTFVGLNGSTPPNGIVLSSGGSYNNITANEFQGFATCVTLQSGANYNCIGPNTYNSGTPVSDSGTNNKVLFATNVDIDGLFTITNDGSSATLTEDFPYNKILVSNDATVGSAGLSAYGFQSTLQVLTNTAKWSKYGIRGLVNQSASGIDTGGDAIGIAGWGISNTANGGTDTGSGAKGTLFGGEFVAHAFSGAVNYLVISGAEFDAIISTGGSAKHRWGLNIAGNGDLRGASSDAAIQIGAPSSGGSFSTSLLLSNANGFNPIPTTGTVIGTDGSSVTATNFADLHTYTFTGDIFYFDNFRVTGAGSLTADGAANITDTTASSSATTGALVVAGGVGVGGAVNVTGAINSAAGLAGTSVVIAADDPSFSMNKSAGSHANNMWGTKAGTARWAMVLGNSTAESGSDAGSDFGLANFNDAGSFLSWALTIYRASGIVALASTTASTSTTTGALTVAGGLGVAGAVYAASLALTTALPVASGGTGDTGSAWSTWSPTIGSVSGTITTVGTVVARYKTLGKTVWFEIKIPITDNGTGAVALSFTLPTTPNGQPSFVNSNLNTSVGGHCYASSGGSTTVYCVTYNAAYPITSGQTLIAGGSYETS